MDENDEVVKMIVTEDGSHSLFVPGLNETYHSRHGAVQESEHVFIQTGLKYVLEKTNDIRLLEVGFGTGLNIWLTYKALLGTDVKAHCTSLETYPLPEGTYKNLNFAKGENHELQDAFMSMHNAPWNEPAKIGDAFILEKVHSTFQDFVSDKKFNLVYYDAFGPPVQPEMWELSIFEKMAQLMDQGGVLVTYCAKGQVRRNLEASSFQVERLKGPPGKREMLRATKR
jgi:tRNA U34 5-methylaminomethyl-2-thiouridine-forming methyltransferase MnmC